MTRAHAHGWEQPKNRGTPLRPAQCWCHYLQVFHLDIIGAAQEAEFTDDQPLEIPPEALRKFVKHKQVDMVGHVWAGSKACMSFVKDYVIL
jgi:hypothetical protein